MRYPMTTAVRFLIAAMMLLGGCAANTSQAVPTGILSDADLPVPQTVGAQPYYASAPEYVAPPLGSIQRQSRRAARRTSRR